MLYCTVYSTKLKSLLLLRHDPPFLNTCHYLILRRRRRRRILSFSLILDFVELWKMSFEGVGISPGNVAVYHGSCNVKAVERKVKIAELVLRILILGLGVLAAALIGYDSEVKVIFSITKKAKFTDMKSLVFLVIVNGIVAAYSLVQAVRCIVGMIRGSILFSKPLAWVIFSGDQVMAYLTLAAVAASAQSSVIGKFGQTELQWMKTCDLYEKFCNQIGEGIASSVVVSICTLILSCMSAYSLFRLYGGSKGKSNSRW